MTNYLSNSTMALIASNSEVIKVIADSSSGASIASIASIEYVGPMTLGMFQKLPRRLHITKRHPRVSIIHAK